MKKPHLILLTSVLLTAAPAHAASVIYQFTGGGLAPTVSGLPAGVTASNFSIGSFPGGSLQSDALRLTEGDLNTVSTGTSFTNNTVLSFSLTIPSNVTLDLISLTYDYTSSGLGSTQYFYARAFSSIDGFDDVTNDTIGLFGKASAGPESASSVTLSLSNPSSNTLNGSNVTAADFTDLTNQTVTFYMPMISSGDDLDYIQFDNVALNFNVIPEPSAALLGGLGLLVLLRRRRP